MISLFFFFPSHDLVNRNRMSFKENPPRSGSAVLQFMVKDEDEVLTVIAVQMFVCVSGLPDSRDSEADSELTLTDTDTE